MRFIVKLLFHAKRVGSRNGSSGTIWVKNWWSNSHSWSTYTGFHMQFVRANTAATIFILNYSKREATLFAAENNYNIYMYLVSSEFVWWISWLSVALVNKATSTRAAHTSLPTYTIHEATKRALVEWKQYTCKHSSSMRERLAMNNDTSSDSLQW